MDSSRTQSLKKQRSINALTPKLSRNFDNNQNTNETVKWMLGAPVDTPPTSNPQQTPNVNNVTNHSSVERFIEEDSESSVDSANATEAKRIQSMRYSKM